MAAFLLTPEHAHIDLEAAHIDLWAKHIDLAPVATVAALQLPPEHAHIDLAPVATVAAL